MGLASNLLNKPQLVKLANSTGDDADPIVVTAVQGSAANQRTYYEVTVLQGQQRSSVVDCGARTLIAVAMPAVLTSTSMTIEVSYDGATWCTAKKTDGTAYSLTVGASFAVPLDPQILWPWQYVRFVMGTAEPTNKYLLAVSYPI